MSTYWIVLGAALFRPSTLAIMSIIFAHSCLVPRIVGVLARLAIVIKGPCLVSLAIRLTESTNRLINFEFFVWEIVTKSLYTFLDYFLGFAVTFLIVKNVWIATGSTFIISTDSTDL